jgi:hypothetical protein
MSALANSGVVAVLIKGVSWVAGVLGMSLDELLLLISLLVGMWLFLIRARLQVSLLQLRRARGDRPGPAWLPGPALPSPVAVDVGDGAPDLGADPHEPLTDLSAPPLVRQVSAVANGGWAGRGASLDDLRLA